MVAYGNDHQSSINSHCILVAACFEDSSRAKSAAARRNRRYLRRSGIAKFTAVPYLALILVIPQLKSVYPQNGVKIPQPQVVYDCFVSFTLKISSVNFCRYRPTYPLFFSFSEILICEVQKCTDSSEINLEIKK